mmetsp:Transcript_79903/g.146099  ORF Transcript_79903/g.146099 Transcript_79903/m.146099 type:complete len:315 (-) Transcript_79903:3878-4822(-)
MFLCTSVSRTVLHSLCILRHWDSKFMTWSTSITQTRKMHMTCGKCSRQVFGNRRLVAKRRKTRSGKRKERRRRRRRRRRRKKGRRRRRKRRRKIDVTAAGPVRTISEKRRRIKTKRRKTGKRTKRGRRRKTETVGVGRIPRSEAVPTLIAGQRLAAAVLEVALGIEREETATGLESEIAATTSASEAARAHPDHGGRRIGVDALLPEAATAIVAAIVSASATEEEARVTAKIGTDVNHEGPHLQRCALAVRARALVGPKGNDRRQRSGRHPGSALHLESGLLPRRSAHPPASAHLPGGAALQEEVAHLRRSPLR